MAEIAKRSADKYVLSLVKDMSSDDEIRVENKKNDRFLVITLSEKTFSIREVGYHNEIFNIEWKDFKRIISRIIEREFPRSNYLKVKIRKVKNTKLKILGR